jgi:multidrug resistance efflux pump
MNAERIVRNRFARIAFAATLIGLGGWAFLPYVTHRVSVSAFVNSELIRVTAPIPGRLAAALPRKGDYLDHPTSVALIEALSPDQRRLLDLERQNALAKETRILAERQLREIQAIDFELGVRAEAYRLGVVDRLSGEAAEAEAERSGCLAEFNQRREVGSRMEELTRKGLISEVRSAEALAVQEVASTHCKMAEARLSRIQLELASAQNGVFLRDGVNDVPYSQQQRDRLVLRRQELEGQILQETARASQLSEEIVAERSRTERLENYQLDLPAGHVVWSTAASPGSAVMEGQTILDLADCEHLFVLVELPERDFEQIKAGDVASIRLIGSGDWRQGRVQQVRGSAGRSDDRLFAAKVPSANPGTINVEVLLPPAGSPTGANSFCGIGRLAEVRFPRSPFEIVSSLTNAARRLADGFRYRTALNTAEGK